MAKKKNATTDSDKKMPEMLFAAWAGSGENCYLACDQAAFGLVDDIGTPTRVGVYKLVQVDVMEKIVKVNRDTVEN